MEVLNSLKEAIKKNEFTYFLKGEKNYKVEVEHYVPANIPTDWAKILTDGIYEYYKQEEDESIITILENGILDILNDNQGIYSAVNIFFSQMLKEKYKLAPFKINQKKILKQLNEKICEKAEALKKDFRWMGEDEKNGLWDEIKRLNENLKEECGIDILKKRWNIF